MPVYVDNMRAVYGRMKMCHLIADTREELFAMVDAIGVQRKWLQKKDTPHEHFDICLSKRDAAVRFGAVEITRQELGEKLRARRAINCTSKQN